MKQLLSLMAFACTATTGFSRDPNFIIIFTDDQGYADLGCFGSKNIKTPHLDRLAGEGRQGPFQRADLPGVGESPGGGCVRCRERVPERGGPLLPRLPDGGGAGTHGNREQDRSAAGRARSHHSRGEREAAVPTGGFHCLRRHDSLRGALRRAEVLGLRFDDLKVADRRVFIADGKGGHQRIVPVSPRFFDSVARYLRHERPKTASTDRLFVVLKGPNTGSPLSLKGLDQLIVSARDRAGIAHCTCHELRHTCLTRLREAGMSLEAIQAQAGHRSIESTRIYLHLSNDWLADEYMRASDAIDANRFARDVLAITTNEATS